MQSTLTQTNDVDFLKVGESCVLVSNNAMHPYVDTHDAEIESTMRNECIKKFFLKAVDITFPKFSKARECGIYIYKGAKAELKIKKDSLRLKTETTSFKSLPEMVTLQEMIFAGTIMPTISYEKRQVTKMKIYLSMLRKSISYFFKKFTKK